ncbi:BTB/POZ protein [Apiosordaria backusii]|uniref:BTB/POZ protein n=1 Tax=Apiosordaria backusii TaxID=314023 RepID=A0AA40BM14_9PEZI|nr:BTB/POZ protein [Apiosordaria backusii]
MDANRFLSSDEKLLETGLFSDVVVKCGSKEWKLHKAILCTRSVWFEKALTGQFQEASTGVVTIQDFEPEAVEWVIRYIYTGVCDIATLKGPEKTTKTNFVTSFEVHSIADFFALTPLAKIALDTLTAEFDSKLPAIQLQHETCEEWLPELCDAIRLVYEDIPISDRTMTPMRQAFVSFVHTARFYFLQEDRFTKFLDEEAPLLALDLFRAMRTTGDFIAHQLDPYCSFCKNKPSRAEKGYYTHLAPEPLKVTACCSNCAVKKDFPGGMQDWFGKDARALG